MPLTGSDDMGEDERLGEMVSRKCAGCGGGGQLNGMTCPDCHGFGVEPDDARDELGSHDEIAEQYDTDANHPPHSL